MTKTKTKTSTKYVVSYRAYDPKLGAYRSFTRRFDTYELAKVFKQGLVRGYNAIYVDRIRSGSTPAR